MQTYSFYILLVFPSLGMALNCYSCQQGYHTRTSCAVILPAGMSELCEDSNAVCIQAVEWFQDGALQLVRRRCWTPPANSTGGFCNNYPYQGQLKQCKSCQTDFCNNDIIYEPLTQCA